MIDEDDEETWPIGRGTPRIDSFEIIDLGEVNQTEEERSWPVGRATMRVDSFEIIDLGRVAEPPGVGVRISVSTDLPADEAAAVLAQVRAAIDSMPDAKGRRFVVELAPPAS
jgi:hypothetical protein